MSSAGQFPKLFGSPAAHPHPAYDAAMVPGTRVRLSGKFLANTGQRTSSEARSVWTVVGGDADFVHVDQPVAIDYWTPEEHAANPLLKFRRIARANLSIVGKLTHRDVV